MLPTLKFLHSMREKDFLEEALRQGLMLTNHEVSLNVGTNPDDLRLQINSFMPILEARLSVIGTPWNELTEERKTTILRGLGSLKGMIPMLCFTEVPQGRELPFHHLSFGGYGVVVERRWLEKNGGDRVMYLGDNSPNSRNLFMILNLLRISSLFKDGAGQILFDTRRFFPAVLDLFGYIEKRENVTEFEWRIAGRHGFLGSKSDAGARIPLRLDDIEMVLVRDTADVLHFERILEGLKNEQSASRCPKVFCQPEVLGSVDPN